MRNIRKSNQQSKPKHKNQQRIYFLKIDMRNGDYVIHRNFKGPSFSNAFYFFASSNLRNKVSCFLVKGLVFKMPKFLVCIVSSQNTLHV